MIAEIYDALLSAGSEEGKARKAAEAVAAYESRFGGVELKIETLRGDVRLMQWMLGLLLAGVASLVVKAFA
jgi:3'-phosphoadenosine 5'-phosphosulfate sulfotransferase